MNISAPAYLENCFLSEFLIDLWLISDVLGSVRIIQSTQCLLTKATIDNITKKDISDEVEPLPPYIHLYQQEASRPDSSAV